MQYLAAELLTAYPGIVVNRGTVQDTSTSLIHHLQVKLNIVCGRAEYNPEPDYRLQDHYGFWITATVYQAGL